MSDMTHIDWCIALEPETCEGDCYEVALADAEGELEAVKSMLYGPEYDLTIETETRLQLKEEELEDTIRRLKI